jgi:hypothetical protein
MEKYLFANALACDNGSKRCLAFATNSRCLVGESVNSRMLTLGVHVFSTEYRGANRNDRCLWGAQFGEEFGEAVLKDNRPAFRNRWPNRASGILVVDRTVCISRRHKDARAYYCTEYCLHAFWPTKRQWSLLWTQTFLRY